MSTEIRRRNIGQGKRVTTLLTEGGYHFPVISHAPYVDRRNPNSAPSSSPENRNLRRHSLHSSTFALGDSSRPDFITSTKQFFSGSKSLNPVRRPRKCPSMHNSQVVLGSSANYGGGDWNTNYSKTYIQKDITSAYELHLRSEKNKTKQTDGIKMHEIVRPTPSVSSYWSQYGRIHSNLGGILGPGVQIGYPLRQNYNVLTGERQGPAWKEHNARISGDKILHESRQRIATAPLIS